MARRLFDEVEQAALRSPWGCFQQLFAVDIRVRRELHRVIRLVAVLVVFTPSE